MLNLSTFSYFRVCFFISPSLPRPPLSLMTTLYNTYWHGLYALLFLLSDLIIIIIIIITMVQDL
jgi:hypothetical protein